MSSASCPPRHRFPHRRLDHITSAAAPPDGASPPLATTTTRLGATARLSMVMAALSPLLLTRRRCLFCTALVPPPNPAAHATHAQRMRTIPSAISQGHLRRRRKHTAAAVKGGGGGASANTGARRARRARPGSSVWLRVARSLFGTAPTRTHRQRTRLSLGLRRLRQQEKRRERSSTGGVSRGLCYRRNRRRLLESARRRSP